jgi:HSP20 family protein
MKSSIQLRSVVMNCQSKRNCRTNVLEELDRGLNQIVRDVFNADAVPSRAPALRVVELPGNYLVECDLPGVPTDAVSIQVEDGQLVIAGERSVPQVPEGGTVVVDERRYSRFLRRLQLSKDADVAGIDAEYGNGVLRITIPKQAAVIPTKIQIRQVS